jgi:ABC-type dipeptide/oligopeptide/nickel transport system permease component
MVAYIIQRIFFMFITLIMVSVVTFAVIELPPGDFLDAYVSNLRASGDSLDEAEIASLRERFGWVCPSTNAITSGLVTSCCMAISAIPSAGTNRFPI